MKHLFVLVLMLRIWGHHASKEDEYPIKFDGVVVQWLDRQALIRSDDGTLERVWIERVEGSKWEDVTE